VPKDDHTTKKAGTYEHTEVPESAAIYGHSPEGKPPVDAPPVVKPPPIAAPFSEQLKGDLAKAQADLDKQTRINAGLKADVAVLEKSEKDIEQAITGYQQALPSLVKDRKDLSDYVNQKLPMAVAAVGKKNQDTINQIINQSDLGSFDVKIASSRAEVRKAKTKYSEAADALEDAQTAFARAKAYLADQTANLKTAKDLMARAEKEDPANPANMYFFITQMQNILNPPKTDKSDLKTVETLRNDLSQVLQNLNTALTATREAKKDWDEKQIDFENRQKDFLDLQTKRLDPLLSGISPLNNVQATPAST
jgi:hypothetical protein